MGPSHGLSLAPAARFGAHTALKCSQMKNRPYLLILFLWLAFHTAGKRAEAVVAECESSFVAAAPAANRSGRWIREAIEIRQISTGTEASEKSIWDPLYQGLVFRTQEFREHLARLGAKSKDATEFEKARALKSYVENFWRRLIDPVSRASEQDKSIDLELDLRGAPTFRGLNGWARLQRISAINRKKISEKYDLDMAFASPSVREIALKAKLHVRRNSRVPVTFGEGVLSSRQLQRLTGIPGYNTMHAFNRDFMKSDDSIYFFVDFQLKPPTTESQYGKHGYWLAENAMPDRAWVSPFVMYNHELGNAYNSSSRFREAIRSATGKEPDVVAGEDTIKTYQPSTFDVLARQNLHHLDFTASDFLALVQAGYARLITPTDLEINQERRRLRAEGITEHRELTIQRLALAKAQEIESQASGVNPLTSIVQTSIGLPDKMEFKVPVFLPRHHIGQEW